MSASPVSADLPRAGNLPARLHHALMPDYNRKATLYWWSVVLLGCAALGHAASRLAALPASTWLQVAVGMAIAMLAGIFPVRIPRSTNSFTAGEIFIFLLLLLHGPAAATLAAAADAAAGSWRTSRRWTSRLASPTMAAVAMDGTGSLLQTVLDDMQRHQLTNPGLMIVAAMLFALLYFLCNALLMSALPRLKRNERLQMVDLFGVFGWIGIAYAGSAAVAALLTLTYRQSGFGVLIAVVPLIAMMLVTLHYFFRQQEADAAMRLAAAEAMEREVEAKRREAEVAARHLQELNHIAFHDSLTGLPNRRRFQQLLVEAVQQTLGDPAAHSFAVMFLDFDRFKLINDSLGHAAGDEFLVLVSHRIQQQLRPGDIVARLGGDEFAILMRDMPAPQDVVTLADRLVQVRRQPYQVADTELHSSASIGVTSSALPYHNAQDVLRDADIAMYKAKDAAKARYAVFTGLSAQPS